MDGGDACVTSIDEPDGPDVIRLDEVDFGGTETVGCETELEKLTDPLIQCHRAKDPICAGYLRSRRWSRGRRRAGRRTGRRTREGAAMGPQPASATTISRRSAAGASRSI